MGASDTYECGYSFPEPKRKGIVQMLEEEYLKRVLKIFEEEDEHETI